MIHEAPKHEMTPRRMERMMLPRRYWEASIFRIPEDCEHRKLLEEFIGDSKLNLEQGSNLLLHGSYGSGKTSAAAVVLKEVSSRGAKALFVVAADLVDIKIERVEFEEYRTLYDRIRQVDFLVIDDVGMADLSKFAGQLLVRILRYRYNDLKSTVLTTNLEVKAFKEAFPERGRTLLTRAFERISIETDEWAGQ